MISPGRQYQTVAYESFSEYFEVWFQCIWYGVNGSEGTPFYWQVDNSANILYFILLILKLRQICHGTVTVLDVTAVEQTLGSA